jgi:hypothetical protein
MKHEWQECGEANGLSQYLLSGREQEDFSSGPGVDGYHRSDLLAGSAKWLRQLRRRFLYHSQSLDQEFDR